MTTGLDGIPLSLTCTERFMHVGTLNCDSYPTVVTCLVKPGTPAKKSTSHVREDFGASTRHDDSVALMLIPKQMLRSICIFIVIGTCTSSLYAQGTRWLDPEFEGSGFAGGSFIGDHQFGNVGVHYGSGYQVGARVNENLNDYWNADLEYSLSNQPLRFTNLTPNAPSLTFGQTVHTFSYSVS